jgi:uncharacterized protein (DUF58 family)
MLIAEMEKTLHAYNSNNATQTASINCLHEIAELCHKRSLIVLFSDLLDDPTRLEDFMQSIQHLKHNKHEVILFHLLDKNTELEFNLGSNPVNLVDMETGEKIKLHPNEIREKYRENMANYVKEIQLKCAQYQVDFYSIDIHHPIQEVLVNFLIKRQRLY